MVHMFKPVVFRATLAAALVLPVVSCSGGNKGKVDRTPEIKNVLAKWKGQASKRWKGWRETEWRARTRAVRDNTSQIEATFAARDEFRKYVGRIDVRDRAEELLPYASGDRATALKGIIAIQKAFADKTVEPREEVERQEGVVARELYNHPWVVGEELLNPTDVLARLETEQDIEQRRKLWYAAVAAGSALKTSAVSLRNARNRLAEETGHINHFASVTARYDMTPEQAEILLTEFNQALRPLYTELHTFIRYELAEKFDLIDVPERLPIHWLPDPWSRDWSPLLADNVPTIKITAGTGTSMLRDIDGFVQQVGLSPLPPEFWELASLEPSADGKTDKAPGSGQLLVGIDGDIRMYGSYRPVYSDWLMGHRELAHAHLTHYLTAEAKVYPSLMMRDHGALREAAGMWVTFLAERPGRLQSAGLIGEVPDEYTHMLHEALSYVVGMTFYGGTVPFYENVLYGENIGSDQLNTRWWAEVERWQGVAAPETRTERFADGIAYHGLLDNPGGSFEHALATAIMFQAHEQVASVAGINSQMEDLSSNPLVAEKLKQMALADATMGFTEAVNTTLGGPVSADAMAAYFQPLQEWLATENLGREATLMNLE